MGDDDDDNEIDDIRFDRPRPELIVLDDKLYERDIAFKTQILNRFGIKVFDLLVDDDENQLICPPNLFASLLILLIGSNGETFIELRDFLEFGHLDDDTVFKMANSVLLLAATERSKIRPNYKLWNSIRVLIDEKAEPIDRIHILIKRYFDSDIDFIDFKNDCHLICGQINELIRNDFEDQNVRGFDTEIEDFTQLIVLSAVTFKGQWQYDFPSDDIIEDVFFNIGLTSSTVKMMVMKSFDFKLGYYRKWDSEVIEIPMRGLSLMFYLILPKKRNGLGKVLEAFNLIDFENSISNLNPITCDLYLPHFEFEKEYDFSKYLPDLSVFKVFAEMTQMSPNRPNESPNHFRANHLLHKTRIEVDNDGFHIPFPHLLPEGINPREIKVDHPFLFFIKDMRTQTLIFIGKISHLREISAKEEVPTDEEASAEEI